MGLAEEARPPPPPSRRAGACVSASEGTASIYWEGPSNNDISPHSNMSIAGGLATDEPMRAGKQKVLRELGKNEKQTKEEERIGSTHWQRIKRILLISIAALAVLFIMNAVIVVGSVFLALQDLGSLKFHRIEVSELDRPVANLAMEASVTRRWFHNLFNVIVHEPTLIKLSIPDAIEDLDLHSQPLLTIKLPRTEAGRGGTSVSWPHIPVELNNKVPINDLIKYVFDSSRSKKILLQAALDLQTSALWIPFRAVHVLNYSFVLDQEELLNAVDPGAFKLASRMTRSGPREATAPRRPTAMASLPKKSRSNMYIDGATEAPGLDRVEFQTSPDGRDVSLIAHIRYPKAALLEGFRVQIPELLFGIGFSSPLEPGMTRSFAQVRVIKHTIKKDVDVTQEDRGNIRVELRLLSARKDAVLSLLRYLRDEDDLFGLSFTIAGDQATEETTSHIQAWLSTLSLRLDLRDIKEMIDTGEIELPQWEKLTELPVAGIAMKTTAATVNATEQNHEAEIEDTPTALEPGEQKPILSVGLVDIKDDTHPAIVAKVSVVIDRIKDLVGFDLRKIRGSLPRIHVDTMLETDVDHAQSLFSFEFTHLPLESEASTFDMFISVALVDMATLIKAIHKLSVIMPLSSASHRISANEIASYRSIFLRFPADDFLSSLLGVFEVKRGFGVNDKIEFFARDAKRSPIDIFAALGVSASQLSSTLSMRDENAQRARQNVLVKVETSSESISIHAHATFMKEAVLAGEFMRLYWKDIDLTLRPLLRMPELDGVPLINIKLAEGETKLLMKAVHPLQMLHDGEAIFDISVADVTGPPVDNRPVIVAAWKALLKNWYEASEFTRISVIGTMGHRRVVLEGCLPPRLLLLRSPPDWSATVTDFVRKRLMPGGFYKEYALMLIELQDPEGISMIKPEQYQYQLALKVYIPALSVNSCIYPDFNDENKRTCVGSGGTLPMVVRADLVDGSLYGVKVRMDDENPDYQVYAELDDFLRHQEVGDSTEDDNVVIGSFPIIGTIGDVESLLSVAEGIINAENLAFKTSFGYSTDEEYFATKGSFLNRFVNGVGELVKLVLPGESTVERPHSPIIPDAAISQSHNLGLEVKLDSPDPYNLFGRIVVRIPKKSRPNYQSASEKTQSNSLFLFTWGKMVFSAFLGKSWLKMRISPAQFGVRFDESRVRFTGQRAYRTSSAIYIDFHVKSDVHDFSSGTIRHYMSLLYAAAHEEKRCRGAPDMNTKSSGNGVLQRIASKVIKLKATIWYPEKEQFNNTDDEDSFSSEFSPPGLDFYDEFLPQSAVQNCSNNFSRRESQVSLKSLLDLWVKIYSRLLDPSLKRPDAAPPKSSSKSHLNKPDDFSIIVHPHPYGHGKHCTVPKGERKKKFVIPCFIPSMCSKQNLKKAPAPDKFLTINISIINALQIPLKYLGQWIGRVLEKLDFVRFPQYMALIIEVSSGLKVALAVNDMDATIIHIDPIRIARIVPIKYRGHFQPEIKEDIFTLSADVSLAKGINGLGSLIADYVFDPTFAITIEQPPRYFRKSLDMTVHYSHLNAALNNARLSAKQRTLLATLICFAIPETPIKPVPAKTDPSAAKPILQVLRSQRDRVYVKVGGIDIVNPFPFLQVTMEHKIKHIYYNRGNPFMKLYIPKLKIRPGANALKAIAVIDRFAFGKIKTSGPYVKEFSELMAAMAVGGAAELTARTLLAPDFSIIMHMSFEARIAKLATFNPDASGVNPMQIHDIQYAPGLFKYKTKKAIDTIIGNIKKAKSSSENVVEGVRDMAFDNIVRPITEPFRHVGNKLGEMWKSFRARGYRSEDDDQTCPSLLSNALKIVSGKVLQTRGYQSDSDDEDIPVRGALRRGPSQQQHPAATPSNGWFSGIRNRVRGTYSSLAGYMQSAPVQGLQYESSQSSDEAQNVDGERQVDNHDLFLMPGAFPRSRSPVKSISNSDIQSEPSNKMASKTGKSTKSSSLDRVTKTVYSDSRYQTEKKNIKKNNEAKLNSRHRAPKRSSKLPITRDRSPISTTSRIRRYRSGKLLFKAPRRQAKSPKHSKQGTDHTMKSLGTAGNDPVASINEGGSNDVKVHQENFTLGEALDLGDSLNFDPIDKSSPSRSRMPAKKPLNEPFPPSPPPDAQSAGRRRREASFDTLYYKTSSSQHSRNRERIESDGGDSSDPSSSSSKEGSSDVRAASDSSPSEFDEPSFREGPMKGMAPGNDRKKENFANTPRSSDSSEAMKIEKEVDIKDALESFEAKAMGSDYSNYFERIRKFRKKHPKVMRNIEWNRHHPNGDYLSCSSEGPEPQILSKKQWKKVEKKHERNLKLGKRVKVVRTRIFKPEKYINVAGRRVLNHRATQRRVRKYERAHKEQRIIEREILEDDIGDLNRAIKETVKAKNREAKGKWKVAFSTLPTSHPSDSGATGVSASHELFNRGEGREEWTQFTDGEDADNESNNTLESDHNSGVPSETQYSGSTMGGEDSDQGPPRHRPAPRKTTATTTAKAIRHLTSICFHIAFNNQYHFLMSIVAMQLNIQLLNPEDRLYLRGSPFAWLAENLVTNGLLGGRPEKVTATVLLAPKKCDDLTLTTRELMKCSDQYARKAPARIPPDFTSTAANAVPARVRLDNIAGATQALDQLLLRDGLCIKVLPSIVIVGLSKPEKHYTPSQRRKRELKRAQAIERGLPLKEEKPDEPFVAHITFYFGDQTQKRTEYSDPCHETIKCLPGNATELSRHLTYQHHYQMQTRIKHHTPEWVPDKSGPVTIRHWEEKKIKTSYSLMITFRFSATKMLNVNKVESSTRAGWSLIFKRSPEDSEDEDVVGNLHENHDFGYGVSNSVALVLNPIEHSIGIHYDGNPHATLKKVGSAFPPEFAPAQDAWLVVTVQYRPIDKFLGVAIANSKPGSLPFVTAFQDVDIRGRIGDSEYMRVGLGANSGNFGHFLLDQFLILGVLPFLPNSKIYYVDEYSVTPYQDGIFLIQLRDSCNRPLAQSPGKLRVILRAVRREKLTVDHRKGDEPIPHDHSHSDDDLQTRISNRTVHCRLIPLPETGIYEVHYRAEMPGLYHVLIGFDHVPGKVVGDHMKRIADRRLFRVNHYKIYVRSSGFI